VDLTNTKVTTYVGGQMEIQNGQEGYIYRGEIAEAAVFNSELMIRFSWLAKGEGFPPVPTKWVNTDDLDYRASLDIYGVSDISDGRLALNSPYTGELVVLFPPDGSKLDPQRIEGLLVHKYPSVEDWLEAEQPGWLEFFHRHNSSPFWQKAKSNGLTNAELAREVKINRFHNPEGATYRWCSMMLDARQERKLPAPAE
jgi:hypothetical protein